jgi:5-methylcytosine-specific restriction endonuclease McrA
MKRSPLKKKSKQKVSILKRKLWEQFAKFIKTRDGNLCYTCGRAGTGSGMHCGHFIPKSVGGLTLYFNEDNCHAQCYNCNINLGGNQYLYGEKLGKEKVDQLYLLKRQTAKWSQEDYLLKIEHYTKLNDTNQTT